VGRSLTFAAVTEWDLDPAGVGSSVGVVTSIDIAPGAEVAAGDVLLTVDLRPVSPMAMGCGGLGSSRPGEVQRVDR
jgi:hypothetical protein